MFEKDREESRDYRGGRGGGRDRGRGHDRGRPYDSRRGDSRSRDSRPRDSRQRMPQAPSVERLEVVSSSVLIIDQFMLGNAQFLERLNLPREAGQLDHAQLAVKDYGGCLFELDLGTYSVHRSVDSIVLAIIAVPARGNESSESMARANGETIIRHVISSKESFRHVGQVFVDTRCVAFLDFDLLRDSELMREYQKLRRSGADKPARDLLRQHGAAVRYGFQRKGDELGVYKGQLPTGEDVVALWPDVSEG